MDADQTPAPAPAPAPAARATCSPRPTSLATTVAEEEDRFRFTPVALRKVPRLWERKPSTPFQARSKSQKVWKRLLTSFRGMGQGQSGREPHDAEDEQLRTEINESTNAGFVRGAKRLRLGADDDALFERGRSFLETKWEMEATMKRRKQATKPDEDMEATKAAAAAAAADAGAVQEPSEADGMGEDGERDMNEVPQADPGSVGSIHPDATEEDSDAAKLEEADTSQETGSGEPDGEDTAAADTKEQEKALIRSALRLSELDGDDAALLNDFLARAQAKREANAALTPRETDTARRRPRPAAPPT
ncbi:hypothetical protein VTN02DRAFT_4663 [Thermoascus thermophilus]